MRKILSLAILMALSLGFANAQDTMITQSGDILTVFDVEVGGSSVFYKLKASDAASYRRFKGYRLQQVSTCIFHGVISPDE